MATKPAAEESRTLELLRGVRIEGKPHQKGEVVKVGKGVAEMMVSAGQAIPATAKSGAAAKGDEGSGAKRAPA
jgi:hypothetical protein